jgi:hypothetical protein
MCNNVLLEDDYIKYHHHEIEPVLTRGKRGL